MQMVRTTISIPRNLHEELRQEAFRLRKSMSAVLVQRMKKRTHQEKDDNVAVILKRFKKIAQKNDKRNPGISFSKKLIEMRYEQ